MNPQSALGALLHVIGLLERIEVRYLVGGSYASGIFGEPRSTRDADLVVELSASQARRLASELGADFYSDEHMMLDSIARGISFNVIHIPSGFKVDFFPAGEDAFRHSELDRRRLEMLGEQAVYLSSPEDIILAKLRWYRDGGEVSERQWRDVLGVLEVQAGRLDRPYLQRWSRKLEVEDLLERASNEAKPPLD